METAQKKRDRAIDEAVLILRRKLAQLGSRRFFGKLPLEVDLQDGMVTTITSTGEREVHKIRLSAAA